MLPALAGFAKINVLLITGENNHKWRETTPAIKKIIESSVDFDVRVCDSAATLTPDSFKGIGLIVLNWNSYTFGKKDERERITAQKEAQWSEAARKAYIEAVANGVGSVAIHAGTSSNFPTWKEWPLITLGTWVNGKTTHGKRGTFTLSPEGKHPITEGLGVLQSSNDDEMWCFVKITNPDAKIIMTAKTQNAALGSTQPQISALAGTFGKGRCFVTFLGHSPRSMDNVFATVLVRGCQWAAGINPAYNALDKPKIIPESVSCGEIAK